MSSAIEQRASVVAHRQGSSGCVGTVAGRLVIGLALGMGLMASGGTVGGTVSAADAPANELAAQVLPIFDLKCGTCHGPQAKKKEKFGYVNDLVKLASNPKLIVRGSSSKSKVWTSIEEGDMPPSDDERSQPLTSAEKAIIKAWINADAPPGTSVARISSTQPSGETLVSADAESGVDAKFPKPSIFRRLAKLTGHLHPLVAHFPIALLMAAGLAEAGWFFTRSVAFTGAVRFCTAFGGLGAIGAAGLGWVNAYFQTSSEALTQHRWLGTAGGLWAIPVVLLCEWGIRRAGPVDGMAKWSGSSRTMFQIALVLGVTLIGVAAHIGGSLVYGDNYFKL